MFYVPTSTEWYAGVSTYSTAGFAQFSTILGFIIGLTVAVLVVVLVKSLVIGGAKKVLGSRRGRGGKRRRR